ncbi:MAG: HAD family hydrolase [Candidatus Heimdallarchaeota archaeon]
MPIKAILFDLWETLICETADLKIEWNKQRLTAFREIFQNWDSNISLEKIQNSYFLVHNELKSIQRSKLLVVPPQTQVELILSSMKIVPYGFPPDLMAKLIQAYISATLNPIPILMPGVKKTLNSIKSFGLNIGLVSNTWSTPGSILRDILREYNIAEYFALTLFSDEVGYPKPHKLIFQEALNHFPGIEPPEFAFVGDDYYCDIYGAKKVGFTTVWLCRDDQEYQRYASNGKNYSDYRITALFELPTLLSADIC